MSFDAPHSCSGREPHAACASFTARAPLGDATSASPSTCTTRSATCYKQGLFAFAPGLGLQIGFRVRVRVIARMVLDCVLDL